MKKAKLFLGAIAVLGIVGGSLAFKAKQMVGGAIIFYTAVKSAPAYFSNDHAYTTNAGGLTTAYTTLVYSDHAYTIATVNAEPGE